jgi:uncharacterized PurR-regulated membrane protein YhhQ (DUF165 family)
MLHPPLSARVGLVGTLLLVLLVICAALIVRADLVYLVRGLMLVGHLTLAAAFLGASVLIVRDLWKRKHSPKSASSISGLLTAAAGTITVVALLLGLRHPSDPKSLFGAFYVFVFYFACAVWGLESRVAAAELTTREQSLRIECRLADLAERLQK